MNAFYMIGIGSPDNLNTPKSVHFYCGFVSERAYNAAGKLETDTLRDGLSHFWKRTNTGEWIQLPDDWGVIDREWSLAQKALKAESC